MNKRSTKLMVTYLVAAVVSCSPSDDGGTQEFDELASLLQRVCLKRSVCGETSLNSCMNMLNNDDAIELKGQFWRAEIRAQDRCMKSAETCPEVLACVESSKPQHPAPRTCVDQPEVRCESNELVWCWYDEAEQTMAIFDVTELGLVCNAAGDNAIDDPLETCTVEPKEEGQQIYARWCDGHFLKSCFKGELTTYDCRRLSNSFECYDGHRCGLPEDRQQCVDNNNSDNYGGTGTCNGDIAQVCMSGVVFEIDCSQFLNATCVATGGGDYTVANCQVEGM
jgi:hypothetical protein